MCGVGGSNPRVPGPFLAQVPLEQWTGLWLLSLVLQNVPGQRQVGSPYQPVRIYGHRDAQATSAGPLQSRIHAQQGLPSDSSSFAFTGETFPSAESGAQGMLGSAQSLRQ